MNSHWNLLSMSTVRAAIALVLLTAGLGASFAQDTPPASSPATEAASEPATSQAATSQAASEPATRPTSRPAANGGPIALNFKDASVRSVLEYLSESAGLIILGADKVEGRITLISRTPVSTEEAVSLLDTVLREKGYAAVHPEGTRTLKVMTINDAKKDLIPVRLGNVPEAIKPSDKLITQIVLVRHADAVKLKADLAAMIPSSADVASNAASNTLIITATESVVRRLVEVISKIDAGLADVLEVKVFQLKYANATAAAKLILDIFKQDQAGQGSGGGGGGGRGQMFVYGMQGPGGGGGEEGQRATKVTASADDRTNTLVVSAAPDILKSIEKVVKDLDANPAETQAVYTYRLKNGVAKNLESVLNATFGATGTSSGTTGQRTNTQQNQRTTGGSGIGVGTGSTFGGRTSGGSSGSTRGGLGTGSTGNTGNTGRTTGGTAGTTAGRTTGGAFGAGRTGTGAGSGAAGDLIGQVYVVADADTNSLLVTTSSNNWPKVKLIIADLDKAVPQVLIKVLMAEVTHNKSLDLGVEFSGLNLRGSQVVSGLAVGKEVANVSGAAPMSTLGRGESGGPNFGVAAQTNGLLFRLDEKYVTAAIRAIANNTKLDVLSRPYILTSDNQEASILVGQQVPFITNSQISDTGQVNNTIQYQDIGIKLDVTPAHQPAGPRHARHVHRDFGPDRRDRAGLRDGQVARRRLAVGPEPRRHPRRPDDRHRRPDAGPVNQERRQGAATGRHPAAGPAVPELDRNEDQDRTADLPDAPRRPAAR